MFSDKSLVDGSRERGLKEVDKMGETENYSLLKEIITH